MKAYIRKSAVLYSMREYTRAIEVAQHAAEKDTAGEHMRDIQQQMIKCNEALSAQRAGETEEQTLERAMKDPEIQVSFFFFLLSFILRGGWTGC